jgi:hypothetical protein
LLFRHLHGHSQLDAMFYIMYLTGTLDPSVNSQPLAGHGQNDICQTKRVGSCIICWDLQHDDYYGNRPCLLLFSLMDATAEPISPAKLSIVLCKITSKSLMADNNYRPLPKKTLARPTLPDLPFRLRLWVYSPRQQPRILHRC